MVPMTRRENTAMPIQASQTKQNPTLTINLDDPIEQPSSNLISQLQKGVAETPRVPASLPMTQLSFRGVSRATSNSKKKDFPA